MNLTTQPTLECCTLSKGDDDDDDDDDNDDVKDDDNDDVCVRDVQGSAR